MVQVIFVLAGTVALILIIVFAITSKKAEKAKKAQSEQYLQQSASLQSPCRILITVDTAAMEGRSIAYSFSLNNGKTVQARPGEMVELSTSQTDNVLIGYLQTISGVAKSMKLSSTDTPFKFQAVDGGFVQLRSRPEIQNAGNMSWKSNLTIVRPDA